MADRDMTPVYTNLLQSRIADVALRLRSLAATIDREASRVSGVPGPGIATYSEIASSVQHEVLWGLANLHLDSLTSNAAEADRLRIEEARP